MQLRRFLDSRAFLSRAETFLTRAEVENIAGVTNTSVTTKLEQYEAEIEPSPVK